MEATVSVFLSYARLDDMATYGRISTFRSDLQHSYEALTGSRVDVFQDVDSVGLGEEWKDRIRAGLSTSSILLAFVSPAFLRSAYCREELRDFLGFLAGPATQRLIVPLVFGDAEMIEETFRQDDLWREVRSRQCLDVPELRTAGKGTELWMRTVERVAHRVAEVLAEPEAAGAATGGTGESTSRPRAPVILAEWRAYAPRIESTLTGYDDLVPRLGAVLLGDGPSLRGAQTFGQRMAATGRLAAGLSGVTAEAEAIAARLRSDVSSTDEPVRHIFRQIRKGALAAGVPPIAQFVTEVRAVAERGVTSLLSARESVDAMQSLIGIAPQVDAVLAQLTTAFLIFTEQRGAFRGWLEEVGIIHDL